MTKLEFLKELESLLPDIPLEEREEALQYYNGYFEDAGEDHEEEIMKELGSPTKVAAIIKAELNSNASDRENRGYFTEKGYHDTIYKEEKFEIVGTVNKVTNNKDTDNRDTNNRDTNNRDTQSNASQNRGETYNSSKSYGTDYTNGYSTSNSTKSSYGNSYKNQNVNDPNDTGNSSFVNGTQNAYKTGQDKKNNSNTVLYLLIGIFTFPVWFPLLMSAFGIAIGIIAAILGIIFGFGVAGITMIGVGIALFFAGLIQISVPVVGALLVGTGLLVLGIGMLFAIACIMLCKSVLPAFIKGIVNLCRLPFKNRSVMA